MSSSKDKGSRNYISDKGLVEIGITRELWETSHTIMHELTVAALEAYPLEFGVVGKSFYVGNCVVGAHFVDNGTIEIEVTIGHDVFLLVRYENNLPTIISIVLAVIESIKDN
jgi:hypothetical protein